MIYTDDSLFPENMLPLIVTAAPYGPTWLPGDAEDIAPDLGRAGPNGAGLLQRRRHRSALHVRDPETGHLTADFDKFAYLLAQVKDAVPEMIIQVGGSISFAPKGEDKKAEWLSYDTRHMLAGLEPRPECVTVAIGTSMMDITPMWTLDDARETHLEDPKAIAAYAGMYTDAGARCRHAIQRPPAAP